MFGWYVDHPLKTMELAYFWFHSRGLSPIGRKDAAGRLYGALFPLGDMERQWKARDPEAAIALFYPAGQHLTGEGVLASVEGLASEDDFRPETVPADLIEARVLKPRLEGQAFRLDRQNAALRRLVDVTDISSITHPDPLMRVADIELFSGFFDVAHAMPFAVMRRELKSIELVLRESGYSRDVIDKVLNSARAILGAAEVHDAGKEIGQDVARRRGRPARDTEELWAIARGDTGASLASRFKALNTLHRRFQRAMKGNEDPNF